MENEKKKVLKEVLKNEVNPLLIGLRNDIKEVTKTIKDKEAEIQKFEFPKEAVEELLVLKKTIIPRKGVDYEDGYTPKKGVDYFTESEIKEFKNLVTPKLGKDYFTLKDIKKIKTAVTPKKGKDYTDGYTPKKGVDYFTDSEKAEFLKIVTPIKGIHYKDGEKGADGKDGKNAVEITPHDIRKKLESLTGRDRLKIKAIHNLEETLNQIWKSINATSTTGGIASTTQGTDKLANLSDVKLTNLSNGQILKWDSALNQWVNANNSGGGGGGSSVWGDIAGEITDQTDLITYLEENYISSLPIRRHSYASPYDYVGYAPEGSSEGANVWTITRITVASNGTTTKGVATNVDWTNRASHTYI